MRSKHIRPHDGAVPARPRRTVGDAFPIADALLALRWADLVRARGYELTFSHDFANADEVLEIHLPPIGKAIARIHRGADKVWVTDCVGQGSAHEDLAVALMSIVLLSRRDVQVLLAPRTPPWLWTFRTAAVRGHGRTGWLAACLAGWLAGARRR